VLGKYSTTVVLPKTKSELVRQINLLGKVEIRVIEPIDKSNIHIVKSEIDRVVRKGRTGCIVLISI
jgi:hypothetical protein